MIFKNEWLIDFRKNVSSIFVFNLTTWHVENEGFFSIIALVIFQQAAHVRTTQPTHTQTHTASQSYGDMASQLSNHPGSPSSLWGHDSPLSDTLNVRGFLTPTQTPTNPQPTRLQVRQRSLPQFLSWGLARECDGLVVTHAEHEQIHTHADWHKPCEWAKWRISRKTDRWLLLSNHGRKWACESDLFGPQLCVPHRSADDALNSAQTNVFPVHQSCFSGCAHRYLSQMPQKCHFLLCQRKYFSASEILLSLSPSIST